MELLEGVKNVMREELGISEQVKKHADEIYKEIVNHARMIGTEKRPGVKIGNFIYRFGGVSVNVTYKVVYVDTVDKFDPDEYIGDSAFLSPTEFDLNTTLVYDRSKNKYIDLDGTLQHEFEHIFQQAKSGKPFLLNDKTRDIYNKALGLINNPASNAEKIVGYTVYYNFKFEKDAYANDLYKTIMDNPYENPYVILKNNMVYKNVSVIRKSVLERDNKKKYEPIALSTFGKGYNWFIGIARNMVKNYMNKVGKVMAKAYKDLETKNSDNYVTDGGRFSVRRIKIESEE